jgi:hypothetical protein
MAQTQMAQKVEFEKVLDLNNPQDLNEFLKILKEFGYNARYNPYDKTLNIEGQLSFCDIYYKAYTVWHNNIRLSYKDMPEKGVIRIILNNENHTREKVLYLKRNAKAHYAAGELSFFIHDYCDDDD